VASDRRQNTTGKVLHALHVPGTQTARSLGRVFLCERPLTAWDTYDTAADAPPTAGAARLEMAAPTSSALEIGAYARSWTAGQTVRNP
jgi:hypothetical protein